MDIFRAAEGLGRAKALIEKGDEHSLRYACLELRLCLEKIVYRQLSQYGDVVPGSTVRTWQPDQLLRLLSSFDPIGTQAGEMSFALEDPQSKDPKEWHTLGAVNLIPWGVFRGFYQKLGSYLHMPKPKSGSKKSTPLSAEVLAEIVEGVKEVTKATAIFAMKAVVSAQCDCGRTVHVGQTEFDDGRLVVCGNTECNAIYIKERNEEGVEVLTRKHGINFNCELCNAAVPVAQDRIWAPVRCLNCSARYRLDLTFTRARHDLEPTEEP
jgi:hypothetical protein